MKIATTLLFLFPLICFADGLPLNDKGDIDVPHTVISLTASQVEELQVLNSVTLTTDQWETLRKVSHATPKRLHGILPISYNDCTCGISYEAIRLNDGRLAVMHEEFSKDQLVRRLNAEKSVVLRVDDRGQMYFHGILIRFPALVEALASIRECYNTDQTAPMDGIATVEVPPGMKPTDAVFTERLKKVYQLLAKKGWNRGEVPFWMKK